MEPACAGEGSPRPAGRPAPSHLGPPQVRVPWPRLRLNAAPGREPGVRAPGPPRAGTWEPRGRGGVAARAWGEESAAICPASPIVPRGVASPPPQLPPPPRAHGERCQGGPSQIEPVPGWGVESGSAERRGPAPGPSRLGCARDVCRMYSGGRARTGGGARGRAGWDLLSAGLGRSSPAPV